MEQKDDLHVGMRVRLNTGEAGQLAYMGPVSGKEGEFLGISLDEKVGRNDGSVGGHRYFEAKDKFGLFVRRQEIVATEKTGPQLIDVYRCTHSFKGSVKCERYDAYLAMGPQFDWAMEPEPFSWYFVRAADGESYHIMSPWTDPSGAVETPRPVMWQADKERNWVLNRSHRILGAGISKSRQCKWQIESLDGGSVQLRNVASRHLLSVINRDGRCEANREYADNWERFYVTVDQVMPLMTADNAALLPPNLLPERDPYLSYQMPFRIRIRSERWYSEGGKNAYSLSKNNKLAWAQEGDAWDLIPHDSGNAFFIRHAVKPLYWRALKTRSPIGILRVYLRLSEERDEIESAFSLERLSGSGHSGEPFYAFRSMLSHQYLSAEVANSVLEKDLPLEWERFTIKIL